MCSLLAAGRFFFFSVFRYSEIHESMNYHQELCYLCCVNYSSENHKNLSVRTIRTVAVMGLTFTFHFPVYDLHTFFVLLVFSFTPLTKSVNTKLILLYWFNLDSLNVFFLWPWKFDTQLVKKILHTLYTQIQLLIIGTSKSRNIWLFSCMLMFLSGETAWL